MSQLIILLFVVYAVTAQDVWLPLLTLGPDDNSYDGEKIDYGKDDFNELFRDSKCGGVIRRECPGCLIAEYNYKDIYYKRLNYDDTFDVMEAMINWNNNIGLDSIHEDFELYGNLPDALSEKNEWDDPTNFTGSPETRFSIFDPYLCECDEDKQQSLAGKVKVSFQDSKQDCGRHAINNLISDHLVTQRILQLQLGAVHDKRDGHGNIELLNGKDIATILEKIGVKQKTAFPPLRAKSGLANLKNWIMKAPDDDRFLGFIVRIGNRDETQNHWVAVIYYDTEYIWINSGSEPLYCFSRRDLWQVFKMIISNETPHGNYFASFIHENDIESMTIVFSEVIYNPRKYENRKRAIRISKPVRSKPPKPAQAAQPVEPAQPPPPGTPRTPPTDRLVLPKIT